MALSITFASACEQREREQATPQAEIPRDIEPPAAAATPGIPQAQVVPPRAEPPPADPLPVFAAARLSHAVPVTDLAWSADGAVIATASSDGKLRLWDASSFALTRTIERPPGDDRPMVSISRDGATVITNVEHEVHVFDGDTGSLRHALAHEGQIFALDLSADATTIASGGVDGLRIWDADGSERRHVEQRDKQVVCLAFSADGQTLASGWGDRRVRLINAATGQLTRTLVPGELPLRLAYGGDGERLAARTGAAQLGIFATATRKLEAKVPLAHPLAFGAGGNLLLAAGPLEDSEFAVTLVDVGSGSIVRGFLGHRGEVTDAMFSPDGSSFASASMDGSVLIWMAP